MISRKSVRDLSWLPLLSALGLLANVASAATLTVTNAADSGPGSLRQTILDANATPGIDIIAFAIGSGVQTILPASPLPVISAPADIDGTTQPGFAGSPLIVLNGANAGANAKGLQIRAGNSAVRGLVINNFSSDGLVLETNGNNLIAGNFIGTDAQGTNAQPNSLNGIVIFASSGNTIGGTVVNARNLISGNFGRGILIRSSSSNHVLGNHVGTDVSGNVDIPNFSEGVILDGASSNNTIGGTNADARNVISGNLGTGVRIAGCSQNRVQGNLIGTAATGASALPNDVGVTIDLGSQLNTVGGTNAASRNVISGNTFDGLDLNDGGTVSNLVQGNFVGLDVTGASALPNGKNGIAIFFEAQNNIIGGTTAAAGNWIAFNAANGVLVQDLFGSSMGNTIAGNVIYGNGALGLNLQPPGEPDNTVTPNDIGDGDTGPNNRQNFPTLTAIEHSNSVTTILGTINTTPNRQVILNFFRNIAADPSGYGEGEIYLGSTNVTTDGNGVAACNFAIGGSYSNQLFTATATDGVTGDTSEFSPAVAAGPGLLQFGASAYSTNENAANAVLTVLRTGGSSGAVSVDITSTNGTAGVNDYTFSGVTLVFNDGEISKTFNVGLIDDALDESDETVTLALNNATGGAAISSPNSAVLTIIDNDPPPSLSINDVAVAEGNSGTTNAAFTVTLSAVSGRSVTVLYATTNGTAGAPADYTAIPSSLLTFNPGVTNRIINVQLNGDLLNEPNETFFINLSSPANATIADGQGQGTIINDDPLPSLSINDVTVAEGNSGAVHAVFTVALSQVSGRSVAVNYATANGSATAIPPGDYTSTPPTLLTFDPGQASKTITVTVTADPQPEPDENFFVNLSGAVNAAIADPQGVCTITELRIAAIAKLASNIQISFTSATNRTYRLEFIPNLTLTNSWNTVTGANNVAGIGGIVNVTDTNAASQPLRFYRVLRLP